MFQQNPNARPWSALIFDLDGTILDSESVYAMANERFFASRGLVLRPEDQHRFTGIGMDNFIAIVRNEYGLTESPDALAAAMDHEYFQLARTHTRAFGPVLRFVDRLRSLNIPYAIASGSSPSGIDTSLSYAGILDRFPLRFSSSQVARGKPAPDVFLLAASKLGVEQSSCLVFEDSRPGVLAALAASMSVLALPAPHEADPVADGVFSRADFCVPGGPEALTEEDMDVLLGLYRARTI